jgi:hypothetical protein
VSPLSARGSVIASATSPRKACPQARREGKQASPVRDAVGRPHGAQSRRRDLWVSPQGSPHRLARPMRERCGPAEHGHGVGRRTRGQVRQPWLRLGRAATANS